MEQEELFDFGFERESDDVIQTGVTPADVLFVFFAVVLGIHDEDVHAAKEGDDFAFLALGKFEAKREGHCPAGRNEGSLSGKNATEPSPVKTR